MRQFLLALAALMLVGSPWMVGTSAARTSPVAQTGRVNSNALREMLTKGLKATRPEENLYIDYVVELVGKGDLPVSYVYASFHYARKRRPDYPFPYFRYSMKTLAKRKNIDL